MNYNQERIIELAAELSQTTPHRLFELAMIGALQKYADPPTIESLKTPIEVYITANTDGYIVNNEGDRVILDYDITLEAIRSIAPTAIYWTYKHFIKELGLYKLDIWLAPLPDSEPIHQTVNLWVVPQK